MKGPNLAAIAWRNVWRNRRRTLLTLSSMAFGIMLAIVFTGLGDAGYASMIDLAARLGGGHVTLQHPEFQRLPSLRRTVVGIDRLRSQALADPDVRRAVPRIAGQTLLATAKQSTGAVFVSFDPGLEDDSSLGVMAALVRGQPFASTHDQGIILGERLAENLGTDLGRKVVYTFTDKRGEIVSGLARVSGIIRTGAPTIDRGLCLLPIDAVREALGYQADEATQLAIFLRDQRRSDTVAARLGTAAGPGTAALTWHDSQPDLAGFIAMKRGGIVFMEVLVMLLIAAGIFNTLFVSVMERLREFGILMAIGFSPGRLFRLVMWESLWLAIVGLGAGALVTALPYYFGHTRGIAIASVLGSSGGTAEVAGVGLPPTMYVGIYAGHALGIGLAVLAATLLAGLYPAWRAGRVEPVKCIKLV